MADAWRVASRHRLHRISEPHRPAETGLRPSLGAQSCNRAAPGPVDGESGRKLGLESPEATLIITCKLSPTAVRDKAFDALLARNHLLLWSAPEAAARHTAKKADEPSAPASAISSVEQPKKNAGVAGAPVDGALARKDNNSAWSENVVVELDAKQLVALLADLQNHPEQFFSIEFPGQSAGDLGVVSDAASSLDDSSSPKPAEAESVPTQDAEAAAGGVVQGREDRDRSGRLHVLFRLSAASGE